MRKNKQSLRSFTAFIVTWAFIVLMVTGLVLYVVPHGRIAYWTHWSLWGLEKDRWAWIHMTFGGVFIVAAFLHLYFNWKPFKQYIADRIQGHLAFKREILIATLATLVLVFLSALDLPPASWIIRLNSDIKNAWVTEPALEPPFGHAEEASLAALARRMDFDLEPALSALRDQGIAVESGRETLEQIAQRNGMTPMAVYALIPRPQPAPVSTAARMTPEEIEARFAGTGLGRKRLTEVCEMVGLDVRTGRERLASAGIEAGPDDGIRDLADANGKRPIELLVIILNGSQ